MVLANTEGVSKPAPMVAAPAAMRPFFTNERRLSGAFTLSNRSDIALSLEIDQV
jgi:hypothetical protein